MRAEWAVCLHAQGVRSHAEEQARALLQCAWQSIFEVHADMPQSASFRQALVPNNCSCREASAIGVMCSVSVQPKDNVIRQISFSSAGGCFFHNTCLKHSLH